MSRIPAGPAANARYWANQERIADGLVARLQTKADKARVELQKREQALRSATDALAQIEVELNNAKDRQGDAQARVAGSREGHP